MNFYELCEIENDQVLADVIEFDDGQVIVKWFDSQSLEVHKSLGVFMKMCVTENRKLVEDGVMEVKHQDTEGETDVDSDND